MHSNAVLVPSHTHKQTPAHNGPTLTHEAYERNCYRTARLNTCPDTIPGIDQGLDPIDNWMNYLPPHCYLEGSGARFTGGQEVRMLAEFEYFRAPNPMSANTTCRRNNQLCLTSSGSASNNFNCCIGLYCNRLEGVCKSKFSRRRRRRR